MEWGFGETKMTAALLLSSLRSDGASPVIGSAGRTPFITLDPAGRSRAGDGCAANREDKKVAIRADLLSARSSRLH